MNNETNETTQAAEAAETFVPTTDVITKDGVVITPTPSSTKRALFERPSAWIATIVAGVVVLGVAVVAVLGMVSVMNRHEVTKTTSVRGECVSVEAIMVPNATVGEDPDLFDRYKAAHPDEAYSIPCPIPIEDNTHYNGR